ncbi:MAG: hypothetical protein KHW87_06130 [Clostridiales bacterium]|nr:hypothetical protein [Clostridiales bacterium]
MKWIFSTFSAILTILSTIPSIFSIKDRKHQNKVEEIEEKLKKHELAQIEKEACVEARIIRVNNYKFKIKIWNSGKIIAKNVQVMLEVRKENISFPDSEKLPFEELEPGKSFELEFSIYEYVPRKLQIKTEWEDENGNKKEKIQWCDM